VSTPENTAGSAHFDFTGHVAIVTGGSRGIGRAIAFGLARSGAKVVVASRAKEACEATAAEIRAAGGEAIGIACHVGDLDQLQRLVDETVATYGQLDLVVNNAANALALPIGTITPEAWQKTQDVNERAALFLVQAALPHLVNSDAAAVLNVVTIGIFTSGRYLALYTAAKSGLMMLTRAMAAELGGLGIRVNALAPGPVDTDMVRNNTEEAQAAMAAATVMKRLADPEEMVGPALFLLSQAASYVTGSVLVADGGTAFH
jgi:NAD(P)-dependent dehydrogenase (short-subunit alcohol dehydrogenase family)